jgi:hypothetical protein
MPLALMNKQERGEVRVRGLGFRAAQSLACCFRAGARWVVKWSVKVKSHLC